VAPKKTSVFNRSAFIFLIILLLLSASPVSADDEVKWLKAPIPSEGWRFRASEPVLSPWSNKWSFTTRLATQEATIVLENPLPGASGVPASPVFQWAAVSGAQRYELIVSADSRFASPVVTRVDDFALLSTAYYWKVRALGAGAASAFTTQREPAPSRPCNFRLLMPTQSPTPQILVIPAPTPLPPAPAPQPPVVPDAQWMIHLIGELLLTNMLLIIMVLALVMTIRRL
jgi:hypothetical protein